MCKRCVDNDAIVTIEMQWREHEQYLIVMIYVQKDSIAIGSCAKWEQNQDSIVVRLLSDWYTAISFFLSPMIKIGLKAVDTNGNYSK